MRIQRHLLLSTVTFSLCALAAAQAGAASGSDAPASGKAKRSEFAGLCERTASGSAFGRFQLAKVAREWNLIDEMWEQLDKTLEATGKGDGDNIRLHEQVLAFLATLEPEIFHGRFARSSLDTRVAELLSRVRPEKHRAELQAIEEMLVREPGADKLLKKAARTSSSTQQRVIALHAVARREAKGNDLFVYRTMLLDTTPKVRDAAVDITRAGARTRDAISYLAPAFESDDPEIRIRTARAFEHLGDPFAIDAIVAAGPNAGTAGGGDGKSPRAHIAILTQQAYVRDFDVEVAQSAAIANPQVDLLTSGTVLDVAVQAVTAFRYEILGAYRRSLKSLAGSDPGPDPSKWDAWKKSLPAETRPSTSPTTGAERATTQPAR